MEQNNNTSSFQTEMIAEPAPLWQPTNCERVDFIAGMQYHAPFVYTADPGQTDLGKCIICTFPPHLVFKVHAFDVNPIMRNGSEKELQRCVGQEEERLQYLHQRYQAIKNGQEATLKRKSVKKIIQEDKGMKYDREFDEPRIVGKVPGMNAYLELIGCLDKISLEQLDWNGEHGILWTMDYALSYALNFFKYDKRKRMASKKEDVQPLDSWREEWVDSLRPFHQPHNGLGYTDVDLTRRQNDGKR